MKASAVALGVLVAAATLSPFADAFTPQASIFSSQMRARSITYESHLRPATNLSLSSFLGMDEDEDEDDDEDDDDDDDDLEVARRYSGAKSPFTGLKL